MHTSTPEVIVRASGTADVVDAVDHARAHGLPIAIRGGGHSIAGLSSPTGGMLIDLADMRGVHVDPDTNRAIVQGGALWADVDRETQAHGLVAPGGVVSDTGVAGLTLGGGYGWVRRKYGLTVDQLVEAEVVTADGTIVTTNETEHPDLFWALQRRRRQLRRRDLVHVRAEPLGPTRRLLRDLLSRRGVRRRPARLARVRRPGTRRGLLARGHADLPGRPAHAAAAARPRGHDRRRRPQRPGPGAGTRATRPLRELGTVLADLSGPTPFTGVQSGFDGLFPRGGQRSFWKSQYLDDADRRRHRHADRSSRTTAPPRWRWSR